MDKRDLLKAVESHRDRKDSTGAHVRDHTQHMENGLLERSRQHQLTPPDKKNCVCESDQKAELAAHVGACDPASEEPCELCDEMCSAPGHNQCEIICHVKPGTELTNDINFQCRRCAVNPASMAEDEKVISNDPKAVLLTRMCMFHYNQFVTDWFVWFPPVPRKREFLSEYQPKTKMVINYLLHTCLLPKIHFFRKIRPISFSKLNVQRFTQEDLLFAADDIVDSLAFYNILISRKVEICEKALSNVAEDYEDQVKTMTVKEGEDLGYSEDEVIHQNQQARTWLDSKMEEIKQTFPVCYNSNKIAQLAIHYFTWDGLEPLIRRDTSGNYLKDQYGNYLFSGPVNIPTINHDGRNPLNIRLSPRLTKKDLCLIIFRSIASNNSGDLRVSSMKCGDKYSGCFLLPYEVSPPNTVLALDYPYMWNVIDDVRQVAHVIDMGRQKDRRPIFDVISMKRRYGDHPSQEQKDEMKKARILNEIQKLQADFTQGVEQVRNLFVILTKRLQMKTFRECVRRSMDIPLPPGRAEEPMSAEKMQVCNMIDTMLQIDTEPSKIDSAIDMLYYKQRQALERKSKSEASAVEYRPNVSGVREISKGSLDNPPYDMRFSIIDTFYDGLELMEYLEINLRKSTSLINVFLGAAIQSGRFFEKEIQQAAEAAEPPDQRSPDPVKKIMQFRGSKKPVYRSRFKKSFGRSSDTVWPYYERNLNAITASFRSRSGGEYKADSDLHANMALVKLVESTVADLEKQAGTKAFYQSSNQQQGGMSSSALSTLSNTLPETKMLLTLLHPPGPTNRSFADLKQQAQQRRGSNRPPTMSPPDF